MQKQLQNHSTYTRSKKRQLKSCLRRKKLKRLDYTFPTILNIVINIRHYSSKWQIITFIFHQQRKDRKSTRLNSSHVSISYAVFCLKKKNTSHPQSKREPSETH